MIYFKSLFSGKYYLVSVFLFLFTLWVIIYISIHLSNPEHQGAKVLLESNEIEVVNQLYETSYEKLFNVDSLKVYFSNEISRKIAELKGLSTLSAHQKILFDSLRNKKELIIQFKVDSVSKSMGLIKRTDLINQYLSRIDIPKGFEPAELEPAIKNLSQRHFITTSYFFLRDSWVLLEILLFAMMGVICNCLYFMSEYIRKGEFNTNETVVYFVKLFYAPVVVLIIFLGATQFLGQNATVLPSPGNTIVLSFVLGFFSGRAIELLSRIKDALFPIQTSTDATDAKSKWKNIYDLDYNNQRSLINEFIESNSQVIKAKYPEIQGLLVGKRNNDPNEKLCLIINVKSKLPESELNKIIPQYFEFTDSKGESYRIPTDIEGVGIYSTQNYFIGDGTKPKMLGLSCGREGVKNETGSIGLKVTKNGIPYVLSCYHVFCPEEMKNNIFEYNPANSKDYVVSPSLEDSVNPQRLGILEKGIINQFVDSAIAKLDSDNVLINEFYPNNGRLGSYRRLCNKDSENQIYLRMIGRSSCVKEGRLIHNYAASVFLDNYNNNHNGELKNVIIASGLSLRGDSGAVVTDSNYNVIGIVVGGNQRDRTIIIPIHTIINHLKLDNHEN